MFKIDESASNLLTNNYADMRTTIYNSKSNNITYDNSSQQYNLNDVIYLRLNTFLRKYEHIINAFVLNVDLTAKHLYRPEYMSEDIYGTSDLWYIILFVNKITTPYEFSTPRVKVFDPTKIEVLIKLFEEYSLMINRDGIDVELTAVKGLHEKSESLFSAKQDQVIPPKVYTAEATSKIISDFFDFFKTSSSNIISGKLHKYYYKPKDVIGTDFNLIKEELISGIKLDHNVNNGGLSQTWDNHFRMEYDGYFYAETTGDYKFRPLFTGDSKMWFDEKEVYSVTSESFQVSRDYFFEQYKNSSFELGDTTGWNAENNSTLVKDPNTEDLVLSTYYDNVKKGFNIATINMDVSKIRTFEELAVTCNYMSMSNRNLLFSGAFITVEYQDGYTETFHNNPEYDYFSNIGEYTDNTVIVSFQPNKTLKSLVITFPVEKKPYDNDTIDGEVRIKSLKVQRMFLWKTFSTTLEGGRWYKIKYQYNLIEQPAPYLQVKYMKPSSDIYEYIDNNLFACELTSLLRNNRQNYCQKNTLYNKEKTKKINEYYSSTLQYEEPSKIFSKGLDYIKETEYDLMIKPLTEYRINGTIDNYIEVYKDNVFWFAKDIGKEYNTITTQSDTKPTYSKIKVVIAKNKDSYGYHELTTKPDFYGNSKFSSKGYVPSIILGDNVEPWTSVGNNIYYKGETSGLEMFEHKTPEGINDYTFKVNINTNSTNKEGAYGVIIRNSKKKGYYMFIIKREEQFDDGKTYLKSGLYHIWNEYDKLDLDSSGKNYLRGILLQPIKLESKLTETYFLTIMAFYDNIKIYSQNNPEPLIDYKDLSEDRILSGGVGFVTINLDNVSFSGLELKYN